MLMLIFYEDAYNCAVVHSFTRAGQLVPLG